MFSCCQNLIKCSKKEKYVENSLVAKNYKEDKSFYFKVTSKINKGALRCTEWPS